jgi:hypothetical protein
VLGAVFAQDGVHRGHDRVFVRTGRSDIQMAGNESSF